MTSEQHRSCLGLRLPGPLSVQARLDGEPIGGLYAAGEVAGFGGGGVHGYNALEGTFLGGCIFSGRTAGRAIADVL
ncbi:FAD-binding protein [Mycobacterium sp.]|uniref:FAD-binding protein n=1 Tax=Mycobacterium sp. TaxID=1785 RepID=UPI003F9883BF